jgi:ABC-2 type transport system permease protein
VISGARLAWAGWWFYLKSLTRSGLFIFTAIIEPLIFATLAYYLFKAGKQPGTLLYASLSAGLMGVWTSTLFGSGGAIAWQRWEGTLEPIVAAPPSLLAKFFPMTIATATIGIYSLTGTLLWGRLVFDIPLDFAHPLWFVIAVVVAVIALGALGTVIASSFVLYRNANALSNMLEFPVWIVTGAIVPLSLLPGWVHYISWVLAPTWGFRAVRAAALGGDPLPGIAMCALLGVIYLFIAQFFLNIFERQARERAALSLT